MEEEITWCRVGDEGCRRRESRHKSVTPKGKGSAPFEANPLISMAPRPGLEPGTYGLTAHFMTPPYGRD